MINSGTMVDDAREGFQKDEREIAARAPVDSMQRERGNALLEVLR
jgi:hypothetical protein